MKFGGVKILRSSRRNKERGLERKEFESEKYSRKEVSGEKFLSCGLILLNN